MDFSHAKNIIDPKFFFSALHNKAVRIKQKDTDKHTYDDHSKEKNHLDTGSSAHL